MSEATQSPTLKDPNGSILQGMTSKATEQGQETNRPDAPSADHSGKAASPTANDAGAKSSPKKRRKVNHACIYCRRSHMTCDLERPCTRCIKRDIGHLCRDEPRDPVKKHKGESDGANGEIGSSKLDLSTSDSGLGSLEQSTGGGNQALTLPPSAIAQDGLASTAPIVQPSPVSAPQAQALNAASQSFLNYDDWNLGSNFQDMHNLHPSYMFSTLEVHNEYNLLNDFLSNSLTDDGHLYAGDDIHGLFSDPSLTNNMATLGAAQPMLPPGSQNQLQLPPPQTAAGMAIVRPTSGFPQDKAFEKYYLAAADPAGNDTPEERMNKLLKAKYEAGLLKPFNYVRGYARLNQYMDKNLQPASRMKILRQLDRFRPKFRERMQSLSDIELVRVEMWFERSLMEYDRLFASMAIPACCWRRTGEIFRGNKELAELIKVPMEQMRDGKLSIHEIIAEGSLVSYWEKFGAIAFDNSQKAILTSCSLRSPDSTVSSPEIHCCFSFTIRRDPHNIPSLIVGNFLPILPPST